MLAAHEQNQALHLCGKSRDETVNVPAVHTGVTPNRKLFAPPHAGLPRAAENSFWVQEMKSCLEEEEEEEAERRRPDANGGSSAFTP